MPHPTPVKTQVLLLCALVGGMLMLSFAAVPLYRLFCQVTGFAGTPQRGEIVAEVPVIDRTLNVFFTTDTSPSLPWTFKPLQKDVTFRIGEQELIFFEVENKTDKPITGVATFNVTPDVAGQYFVKVKCFCYDEVLLEPKQKVILPVSFYIDPRIINEPQLADLTNMTLSYTFFKANAPTTN